MDKYEGIIDNDQACSFCGSKRLHPTKSGGNNSAKCLDCGYIGPTKNEEDLG